MGAYLCQKTFCWNTFILLPNTWICPLCVHCWQHTLPTVYSLLTAHSTLSKYSLQAWNNFSCRKLYPVFIKKNIQALFASSIQCVQLFFLVATGMLVFIILILGCFLFSFQSNFAMGCTATTRHTCFMLDFGLSRQYVDQDGFIRPVRILTLALGLRHWRQGGCIMYACMPFFYRRIKTCNLNSIA